MYSYSEVLDCQIRPRIIFVFFVFYVSFLYYSFWGLRSALFSRDLDPLLCYKEYENITLQDFSLDDVFDAPTQPQLGRSIFFVDTICGNPKRRQWVKLNARQACAVESAARHNNNTHVFVLFLRPVHVSRFDAMLQAFKSYKNIHLLHVNLWRLIEDTPAEEILNSDKFFQTHFLTERVSDLLRLLTLWRWGGIHLDFETLTLRSLHNLPANFGGWQSPGFVGSGVLNFALNGTGRTLLENVFFDFLSPEGQTSSKTHVADLLTNRLRAQCLLPEKKVDAVAQCLGFQIFNKNTFYELDLSEWKQLFLPDYRDKILARVKDSYTLYTWGKWSYSWYRDYTNKSAFDVLASRHCPHVFRANFRRFFAGQAQIGISFLKRRHAK